MGWQIDYLQDIDAVRVTTSGTMRLDDIRQMTIDALAAGNAQGANRFLIDHRLMLPAMSNEDIFDLYKINAGLGVDASMRAAIVYNADSAGKDDFFFYEVHTMSRGASNIRLFTDLLQAMDWLAD